MISSSNALKDIKAVVFDAFGTVVHIPGYRRPYRQLIDYLKSQGVLIKTADSDQLMKSPVELSAVGQYFGFTIPTEVLTHVEKDLQYDLDSTVLFEDVLGTVSRLQTKNFRVGICSNLALPYSTPVKALLPRLDAYAWSYEVGAVKPDSRIYENVCDQLGCLPQQVLMVGDTLEADYFGPHRFGMRSLFLSRSGGSKLPQALNSLSDLFL